MEKEKKTKYWKACYILALLISLLAFTPLVIPYHTPAPMIGNVPYTLWAGYVVYVLLVILTYIGTKVYPDNDHQEK